MGFCHVLLQDMEATGPESALPCVQINLNEGMGWARHQSSSCVRVLGNQASHIRFAVSPPTGCREKHAYMQVRSSNFSKGGEPSLPSSMHPPPNLSVNLVPEYQLPVI